MRSRNDFLRHDPADHITQGLFHDAALGLLGMTAAENHSSFATKSLDSEHLAFHLTGLLRCSHTGLDAEEWGHAGRQIRDIPHGSVVIVAGVMT